MKKMLLAIAATMMMTAAMAQDDNKPAKREEAKPDRTEMLKKRTDDVVKQYGLNEEQSKKLFELNSKYADKMGRGFRGQQPPRGDRRRGFGSGNDDKQQRGNRVMTDEQRKEMQARRQEQEKARNEYEAELQKIMTPEQYTAYKADMEKRMKQGGPRGPREEKQQ